MAAEQSILSIYTFTIEDQIKNVEKIAKDCDQSRKSLDSIVRRVDELYDEMKRYKEFLENEKSRRDPAIYKTNNSHEKPSVYNDQICATMVQLTGQLIKVIHYLFLQLKMEWSERLNKLHNQRQAPLSPRLFNSRNTNRN